MAKRWTLPVCMRWWCGPLTCSPAHPCAGWATPPTARLEPAEGIFSVPLFSSVHHTEAEGEISEQFINWKLTELKPDMCRVITRYERTQWERLVGWVFDLCLLSSMCCIHLCSSAALAHVKSLESTTGPGSKEEQYKSRSGRHNVHSVISSDSLLISNMCGECGASVSRETTRTESPDRGRMPCGEKTKIKVKHVQCCVSGSPSPTLKVQEVQSELKSWVMEKTVKGGGCCGRNVPPSWPLCGWVLNIWSWCDSRDINRSVRHAAAF